MSSCHIRGVCSLVKAPILQHAHSVQGFQPYPTTPRELEEARSYYTLFWGKLRGCVLPGGLGETEKSEPVINDTHSEACVLRDDSAVITPKKLNRSPDNPRLKGFIWCLI